MANKVWCRGEGSLVSKEHALALLYLVLAGHTVLLCSPLLLSPGERQLSKQRNGLPVPVEHQDVVLVHDGVVATANGLQHTHIQPYRRPATLHHSMDQ